MTMQDDFRLLENNICPRFTTLIEHEAHSPTWRIVAREQTITGFSRYSYILLANKIRSLPVAKRECHELKHGPKP